VSGRFSWVERIAAQHETVGSPTGAGGPASTTAQRGIATHQTPSHSAKAITTTTITQPIRDTAPPIALPDRLNGDSILKKGPAVASGAHQPNRFANWPVADSPDRKTPVAEPPRSLARDSLMPRASLERGTTTP